MDVSKIHYRKREGVSSVIYRDCRYIYCAILLLITPAVLWSECITLGMCLHLGMGLISFHK